MELNYYRRLRELREDHDYSQADIGKRLGMSKQQYFLYEKGYRDAQKISAYLQNEEN